MNYLEFENAMTADIQDAYILADNNAMIRDEVTEALRAEVLRIRCLARDTWINMGNEVPEHLEFNKYPDLSDNNP